MKYHLRLTKGLSFCGVVTASRQKPDVYTEDGDIAAQAVATGYFELVGDETPAPLVGHLDPEQLESMSLKELKALAADMGLNTKGLKSKEDFIDIIIGEEVEAAPDAVDMAAIAAMSDEELAAFVKEHDIDLTGCQTREDGLRAISVALGGSETMIDLQQA